MKIALDYDLTYSRDPRFWQWVIRVARFFKHDVRIVTARDERLDRTSALVEVEKYLPVIYCRGIAKKWYCAHFSEDFIPDIWVDDKPESIIANSTATPESLVDWRLVRAEGPVVLR